MRRKIIFIVVFFLALITGIFITKNHGRSGEFENKKRDAIVQLNEIKMLYADNEITEEEINERIDNIEENLRSIKLEEESGLKQMYIAAVIFILIIFSYIYLKIIRPFIKLEKFSLEISKGNFDSPLYVERKNIFGEFTWAFDMMRNEIKYLRESEKRAVENNKTVIATISHDIKTPVASIRAYSEALKENMDKNYERRDRYLKVIIKKCDEVAKLTNDLFLHSLSDLERLKIEPELVNSKEVIGTILENMSHFNYEIQLKNNIPETKIFIDKKRLEQVFENIISNSIKYAEINKSVMEFKEEEGFLYCIIDDFGKGINDEDMPFIFEKFYRGKNVKDKDGAGLGLYIVKYIMDKMNGQVLLKNRQDGLRVILKIKIS